jgi:integrase
MSIFKRPGSPNWYTEIQVGGRRVVRSTGTVTHRAAKAFERRLREELKAEAARIGTTNGRLRKAALGYTVDQAFGRYWLDHASKLRWAHEVEGYAKRIVAIIGDIRIADLTDVDCAHLTESMRDAGSGLVAINRAIAVLRACHTMAGRRWGCPVQRIDWRMLKAPEPKERIRWITREQAGLVLSLLPPHTALIVEFALYTGLRKREILSLRWGDVDLGNGFFEVEVKGGSRRQILLSDTAREVVERCDKSGSFVFDGTNLRKHFEAALDAAKIENFRFHDLRHTNATWLRQDGASLEIIRRSLGHSSITVTQRYAHVHDKEVLAAANSIKAVTPTNVVRFARPTKPSFIYFMTDGKAFKIGRSTDPERRLKTFQVGHPGRLWLIGTVSAAILTEREAHTMFADCASRGEWFTMTATTLKVIEGLCRDAKSQDVVGLKDGLTSK